MNKTIGIFGGGQLGRMFAMAAHRLGYRVVVLDPAPDGIAAAVADRHLCAPLDDPGALDQLARMCAAVIMEGTVPFVVIAATGGLGLLQVGGVHLDRALTAQQVDEDFRFIVKAPASVSDALVRDERGRPREPNPLFLDPEVAEREFIRPTLEGLRHKIGALVQGLSDALEQYRRRERLRQHHAADVAGAVEHDDIEPLAGREAVRHLDHGALGVAVDEQVGLGVRQDRAADLVGPVIVVGDAAQRRLDAAEHDRHVLVGLAAALRVDDGRAVRPLSALAAGRVGVVVAQAAVVHI